MGEGDRLRYGNTGQVRDRLRLVDGWVYITGKCCNIMSTSKEDKRGSSDR